MIVNCPIAFHRVSAKKLSRYGDAMSRATYGRSFGRESTDVVRYFSRQACRGFPYSGLSNRVDGSKQPIDPTGSSIATKVHSFLALTIRFHPVGCVCPASALKHARSAILMSVRSSNPVFTVERSGFLAYFKKLAEDPEHRIALLGDSEELGISHQYFELIGRQHGVNVQSFRDGAAALRWIRHKAHDDGAQLISGATRPPATFRRPR